MTIKSDGGVPTLFSNAGVRLRREAKARDACHLSP